MPEFEKDFAVYLKNTRFTRRGRKDDALWGFKLGLELAEEIVQKEHSKQYILERLREEAEKL